MPVVLFIGFPVWLTWRAVRQEKRDRALVDAIGRCNVNAALSLLNSGADPNAQLSPNASPSFWHVLLAVLHGRRISPTTDKTALQLAVWEQAEIHSARERHYKLLPVVQALLDHGADAKKGGLMLAVSSDLTPIVRLLLEHGADVHLRDTDGQPPTAMTNDPELLKILLEYGADVNVTFNNGQTPLMVTTECDSGDITSLLLESGANINVQDSRGWTALMYTATDGDLPLEAAKSLLAHRPDLTIRDKDGKTALQLAKEFGIEPMIKLLKQAGAKE
jgi:ankyrin repeat protein